MAHDITNETSKTYTCSGGNQRGSFSRANRTLYYQLSQRFKTLPSTTWEPSSVAFNCTNLECSLEDDSMTLPDFYTLIATNIVLTYMPDKQHEKISELPSIIAPSKEVVEFNSLYQPKFVRLLNDLDEKQTHKAWLKFKARWRAIEKDESPIKVFKSPITRLNAITKLSAQLRSTKYFSTIVQMIEKQRIQNKRKQKVNIASFVSGEEILATLLLYCVFRIQTYLYLKPNVSALIDAFSSFREVTNLIGKNLDIFPRWIIKELKQAGHSEKVIIKELRRTLGNLVTNYGTPATAQQFEKSNKVMSLENHPNERAFEYLQMNLHLPDYSFTDKDVDLYVLPMYNMYKNRMDLVDYSKSRFPKLENLIKHFMIERSPLPTKFKIPGENRYIEDIHETIESLKLEWSLSRHDSWNVITILVFMSSWSYDLKSFLIEHFHDWLVPMVTNLRSNERILRESAVIAVMALLQSDLLSEAQHKSANLIIPFIVKSILQGLISMPDSCAWFLALYQHLVIFVRCECLPNYLIDIFDKAPSSSKFIEHFSELVYLLYHHWSARIWLSKYVTRSMLKIIEKLQIDADKRKDDGVKARIKKCLNRIHKVSNIQQNTSVALPTLPASISA